MSQSATYYPQPYTNTRFRIFEEAREAVIKLKTLNPLLSSADKETLSLLLDKEIMNQLETSLNQAEQGKLEPLENIIN